MYHPSLMADHGGVALQRVEDAHDTWVLAAITGAELKLCSTGEGQCVVPRWTRVAPRSHSRSAVATSRSGVRWLFTPFSGSTLVRDHILSVFSGLAVQSRQWPHRLLGRSLSGSRHRGRLCVCHHCAEGSTGLFHLPSHTVASHGRTCSLCRRHGHGRMREKRNRGCWPRLRFCLSAGHRAGQ